MSPVPGAILSLDQSLSGTGWVLLAGDQVTGGVWPLCDGIRHRAQGFRTLFGYLDAMHKDHQLAEILHEEPISGPKDTTPKRVALFGLVAIIELFGVSRGIKVTAHPSQSWRGTFFSAEERKQFRGKDWKRPAIERSRQLGHDPSTDDEAEAFAILDHHLHCQRIIPPWRVAHPFLETLA